MTLLNLLLTCNELGRRDVTLYGVTLMLPLSLFLLFSETENPSHPLLGDQNPVDVLRIIINTVSVHVQKGGTMTSQEDVLECLQPFCADVTVSAAVKTTVLQLMEESFDLSGEDTFLLLFYQTDAVVSSTWNKKVAVSIDILLTYLL